MKLKLLAPFALATCGLLSLPSYAEDDVPPPDHPRYEEFCKNNPTTCEVGKERRQAQKEWCEKNADKCQKLKDERRARREKRREEIKKHCDANPADCEKHKAEFREHMEDRRDHRRGDGSHEPDEPK